MKKKTIIVIVLIAVLLITAGYWYYKETIFSKSILKLEILGPENIPMGQEFEYTIKYKNNSNFTLQEPRLDFEYPESTINQEGKISGYGNCMHCKDSWSWKQTHTIDYDNFRAMFPLCEECKKEYTNPSDRRFHAESIACPVCGPQLAWHDSSGRKSDCADMLAKFRDEIKQGRIVALRGIGGFLLTADAFNSDTIGEKSVVRPTYSYMGKFTISNKTITQIIEMAASKLNKLSKVSKIKIRKKNEGIFIEIDVILTYGENVVENAENIQKSIKEDVEHMTNINVLSVDVHIKSVLLNC